MRGANADHVDTSVLDLLGLRRLTHKTFQESLAAASRGHHDRLGFENDLLAAARDTHGNRLYPRFVETWRGTTVKNPLVVPTAEDLDQATLGNASVRQSNRGQAERRDEIRGQCGGGETLERRRVRGRNQDPVMAELETALFQVGLHDVG